MISCDTILLDISKNTRLPSYIVRRVVSRTPRLAHKNSRRRLGSTHSHNDTHKARYRSFRSSDFSRRGGGETIFVTHFVCPVDVNTQKTRIHIHTPHTHPIRSAGFEVFEPSPYSSWNSMTLCYIKV